MTAATPSTPAGHRIARIETAELLDRYPRTIGRNARLGSHGAGGPVRIFVVTTDSGATGWGLAGRGDRAGLDAFVGRELGDVFDAGAGVLDTSAEPLDFALHDLAGQLLGVPVSRLLGDGPPDGSADGDRAVTCYSGAIYFDDLDPDDAPRGIAAVLDNCKADYAAGFRALKLKIGRGNRWMDPAAGVRRDIEVTRTVRETYPDIRILVDANDGYTGTGFLDYLDAVHDCDLFWIEEPFRENHDDLAALQGRLHEHGATTVVADGEAQPEIPQLLRLAEDRLLDVLLMDVVGYGLTPWRAITPALLEIGTWASPHAWGQPLKTLYAAQMALGLGNVLTVEGVPGHTTGVDSSGYQLVEGRLHVPAAPGFGLPVPDVSLDLVAG
ncbi:enolase-like domain-containing protein [Flindersiella endophytica]